MIGYARVSTADQNPQLQLDALDGAGCLKVYTDHAGGTKADRPQWNACLADLRAGDNLIIWRIDRLGRNLRDLINTSPPCRPAMPYPYFTQSAAPRRTRYSVVVGRVVFAVEEIGDVGADVVNASAGVVGGQLYVVTISR